MSDWQPIETIPEEMLDGRRVWVKRVYNGIEMSEGWAVFDACHDDAPQRQPLGLDPLNRLPSADYAREAQETLGWAETRKWLKPDRMYSYPTPTHWKPLPEESER